MSEPIKMSDNDVAEVRMLQRKFQDLIYKLGTLQVEKMELDRAIFNFAEKENKLKEEWSSIQKLESGLLDTIVKKYGEGSLNMSNGTFIPDPSKSSESPIPPK